MIQLPDKSLSPKTAGKLAGYQQKVDAKATYAERVDEAKRLFGQANQKGNSAFDEVKGLLCEMSCGCARCHYCEDSKADEVEHILPKSWYPGSCFVWDNYCYACGPCNTHKGNKFSIRETATGLNISLKRKDGDEILPPPEGEPLLVNPRHEQPLDYLFLDITYHFRFTPLSSEPDSFAYQRAEETIHILGLNERADLVKARRQAYGNFRARLREYIQQRDGGAPESDLKHLVENLKGEHHQTVWQEMKRQHSHIPELKALFGEAPETLRW